MSVSNSRNAVLLALSVAGIVSAAGAQSGRTVYRIEVTAPGTKSQGLRGYLYDERGQSVEAGADVVTPVGQFRWVECRRLWDSCGRWRTGSPPPTSTYIRQGRPVLVYRILREERRDGSHWTGDLPGIPATARAHGRVETPMGVFRWTSGRAGRMFWRGWLPQDWPDLPFQAAGEGGSG